MLKIKNMKKIVIGLIIFGLTVQSFAQDAEVLPEIEIKGINYKYLNNVGGNDVAIPVKILERKVGKFDLVNSKYYVDEVRDYYVYFEIPEGRILAVYDELGEIIRTSEKFIDIPLPLSVSNAIVDEYPGWKITGDIYLVIYRRAKESASKTYKLFIEKDGKRKKLKTDEKGNFI